MADYNWAARRATRLAQEARVQAESQFRLILIENEDAELREEIPNDKDGECSRGCCWTPYSNRSGGVCPRYHRCACHRQARQPETAPLIEFDPHEFPVLASGHYDAGEWERWQDENLRDLAEHREAA